MLIAKGRRWASFFAMSGERPGPLAERLEARWTRLQAEGLAPVTQLSLDEANILGRWLARHDGHPAILPLPEDGPIDWRAVAAQALDLELDELNWTPPAGEDILLEEAIDVAIPEQSEVDLMPVDLTFALNSGEASN